MRSKTKWEKLVTLTIVILIGILLTGTGKVEAALQANPTTHSMEKKEYGSVWIQQIREMETSGQTMGLNETINTDLTPTSSNNIDVHMMKSTEYGAMAILSASGFGWSGTLSNAPVKSTTGNVTGVYITGDRYEWTASIRDISIVGKDARYYDVYNDDQISAKAGDALGLDTYASNPGCSGWHDAGSRYWLDTSGMSFRRGQDGIFSFRGNTGFNDNKYCGRGVAVVKSGI